MKKLFVFFMAVMLVVSVTGCGDAKKGNTYTGTFDECENSTVTLNDDGKFVLKMQKEEEGDSGELSMLGIEGNLIMSADYTVNGTYTVADDNVTVTLIPKNGTVATNLSGNAADRYREIIKSFCDSMLNSGEISQEEYDAAMSETEGVKDIDDIGIKESVIVVDDKTMTFTVKDKK